MLNTLRKKSIHHSETNLHQGKYFDLTFDPFKKDEETDKIIIFIRDVTEKKLLRAEAIRAGHLASLGELAAGANNKAKTIDQITLFDDDDHLK
ncbi:MAG: hypothetical protein K8R86_13135 [Bacteroidales bacterium]|nr:hypothetical protein [Bacteroidales bacterium]